ncbi:hypothetical protein MNBD_GAMMA08-2259 [hydrothermal vent metagenome]|uniref:Outer membrane protein n=1 Tax=hydrothermal vent metagenome TaxID=652676 RepID=A0A3B0XFJ8_9ZZZZ
MIKNPIFFSLLFLSFTPAHADNKISQWEAGVGLAYFSSPHYLGSDQSANYILPYPHVMVKSERFSINRNSIEGHVAEANFFKLDLTFGGNLKVDSDDNRARAGMPDLDYVLEAGPSLKFLLHENAEKNSLISFDIPIRASIATDFSNVEAIGWRVIPTLHLLHAWPGKIRWELDGELRYLYGSKKYHDYFYTVDTQFVTADRPAYQSESGTGGVQVKLRLKTYYRKMTLGIFMLYSDVSSAVYADSPLVIDNTNFSLGIFASWTFAQGGEG